MENILIDTDLGFDCDDAGVLVLANKLYKKRKVNILAVTHCVNKREGGVAIKKINDFYGNGNIPVAVSDNYAFDVDYLYEEFFLKFKYHDDFKGFSEKPSFYGLLNAGFTLDALRNDTEKFASADELIAQTLINAKDNSVVLLCIGQLNTFAKALAEHGELLKQKVKKAVVMCGNFQQNEEFFDDGETYWPGEFNIIMDKVSAKTVFAEVDFPIDVIDYNQGDDVLTGAGLIEQGNPAVYRMYQKHGKGKECSSWDPIAFLCASGLYEDCFEYSPNGRVIVDDAGRTTFCIGEGRHRLVSLNTENKKSVREIINNLFAEKI